MIWRALFAFAAMPGMVAYVLPVLWLRMSNDLDIQHPWGLVPLVLGTAGLLWCVRDFLVRGQGTLAPWSPPQRLVVTGLYRWSRNPMYVCVIAVLAGWAGACADVGLFLYGTTIALAFHLRVVHGEEPWLAGTHGADWAAYASRVPRWFRMWPDKRRR